MLVYQRVNATASFTMWVLFTNMLVYQRVPAEFSADFWGNAIGVAKPKAGNGFVEQNGSQI